MSSAPSTTGLVVVLSACGLVLGLSCELEPSHVVEMERAYKDVTKTIGGAGGVPSLGMKRGASGVGDECDYSFQSIRCAQGLRCDRGDAPMQKMADGRMGITGVCVVTAVEPGPDGASEQAEAAQPDGDVKK